jgi:hypothetical protein
MIDRLGNDPVAMTWRLAGDNHTDRICTPVQRLMLLAWRNFDSVARLKNKQMMFDFESQLTLKNVEKLPCMDMGVPDLACSRGHELFNDAEIGSLDEVPAIAVSSQWPTPFVVLG